MRHACAIVVLMAAVGISAAAHAATASFAAIHATAEGADPKNFDSSALDYEKHLQPLPQDTFTTINQRSLTLTTGADVTQTINERYQLELTEVGVESEDRVRMVVTIEGKSSRSNEPVTVLEMRATLAAGKPVVVRGLPMDDGEIIVVLKLQ